MVPSLPLLLLMGLSVCAVAGDGGEELTLSTEAGSWVTVNLQVGAVASIQLQLHEVKRGKASQFFGLMGKRVRGIHPIQPWRTTDRFAQIFPSACPGEVEGIRRDKWFRAHWAGEDYPRKVARMWTNVLSESHSRMLPQDA